MVEIFTCNVVMFTSFVYISCQQSKKPMTPVKKESLNFYGYIRISTKRQASRRGIKEDMSLSQETQLEIIKKYVKSKGGVLHGYEIETESGTKASRPMLKKCISMCNKHNYNLITAKMDRLYRNVEAMSKLLNTGIDFTFCDFPDANRLTIHLFSAIAEYEATLVKSRVLATINRKRELNIPMGEHKNSKAALRKHRNTKLAQSVNQTNAYYHEANIDAGDTIVDKYGKMGKFLITNKEGKKEKKELPWTFQRIAEHLNKKGKTTRYGREWTAKGVQLLHQRYSNTPIEMALS